MLALCILVCCAGCSATVSAANSNGTGAESESADGTPPEKPDGEPPEKPDGEPPEMPDGKAPNGAPPDKPGGGPGGFGGSGEVTQGTSANTITEDGTYSGETYTSTGDDENALRIDGAEAELKTSAWINPRGQAPTRRTAIFTARTRRCLQRTARRSR